MKLVERNGMVYCELTLNELQLVAHALGLAIGVLKIWHPIRRVNRVLQRHALDVIERAYEPFEAMSDNLVVANQTLRAATNGHPERLVRGMRRGR